MIVQPLEEEGFMGRRLGQEIGEMLGRDPAGRRRGALAEFRRGQ